MIRLNFLKSKKLKKKAYSFKKDCIICGKKFTVKCNQDNLILTDCFHSYLPKRYFLGWTYEIKDLRKKELEFKPIFENKFYKIVGFCKWSRDIYYFFWKLICGRQKIEYWECVSCNNRENDL